MPLFEQWSEIAHKERTQEEYDEFWGKYLPAEQEIYQYLLSTYEDVTRGTITELASKFEMDDVTFSGFLDGINSSLTAALNLEEITSDSTVELSIDFEKLFFNMLDAKADWLYNLEEWTAILTDEERKGITKEYNRSKIVIKDKKIGRNDPCPCGSGKKYKQCCINK